MASNFKQGWRQFDRYYMFTFVTFARVAHSFIINGYTEEPVYYGHLGINKKCPDYQGTLIFLVSLYDKVQFGTIARCVDYAGVLIFKCPD